MFRLFVCVHTTLRRYPLAPVLYDSEPRYGAYKSVQASPPQCCTPGTKIPVSGAKVVVVKQNRNDFLHLNEIEIFDEDGNNVALEGNCYSFSKGYGGDPVSVVAHLLLLLLCCCCRCCCYNVYFLRYFTI